MTAGYTGKILVVDLTSAEVKEEQLPEKLYREFIGDVGLGVRLLGLGDLVNKPGMNKKERWR